MSNHDGSAVVVKDLYKSFRLPHEQHTGVKQALVNIVKRKKGHETQHVLDDVSFEIQKGEFFGIVGRNGSGKSTLLKLLAGIYAPDKGLVQVNGSLTPFIELGVGFNPELTGRENVFMNGALLGLGRPEMEEMYDEIVEFAELERFMDQKLKNYSSGMQVRLAFSIAIKSKSEVLIFDEVLAVGDASFQSKCYNFFETLRESKKTVIFVSHDVQALKRFCTTGILLDGGEIIASGAMPNILEKYNQKMLESVAINKEENNNNQNFPVEVASVLLNSNEKDFKFTFGQEITVTVNFVIHESMRNPIVGLTLWKGNASDAVFAYNTSISGIQRTGSFVPDDTLSISVTLPGDLNDGDYIIEPAVANESASLFYTKKTAKAFVIKGSENPHSILSLKDRDNFNFTFTTGRHRT